MKIPGFVYIIIGVFVTGLSGYVYKFIPNADGSPNMSMAIFFFIGVIFLIVGFTKVFLRKIGQIQDEDFNKMSEELRKSRNEQDKSKSHPQQAPIHNVSHEPHKNRIEEQLDEMEKRSYSQTHPYPGVQSPQAPAPQRSGISLVVCKRCGDKNTSTSNYCRGCGNRLK